MKTALRYNEKQNENINWKTWKPQRSEIYLVDLGTDNLGCEQNGLRPAVIISNNIGNSMGSIVVIAPLTTAPKKLPIHVKIGRECGLTKDSYILTEHIRSISKERFFSRSRNPVFIGSLSLKKQKELQDAIKIELDIF